MRLDVLMLGVAAAVAGSGATAQSPTSQPRTAAGEHTSEPGPLRQVGEVPRRIMPFMTVSLLERSAAGPSEPVQASAIGGYTRLLLTYEPPSPAGSNIRVYDVERRPGLSRWLAGKAIARVLTIRTTLAKPKLAVTTTIASMGRESSNKVGETWTTEFNSKRVMTPFFRIDPESALSLESAFTLTSSYDASIAGAVLDVLRRGAKLVAPAASLVTSLNEDRFQDASNFVDQSLKSLFKEAVTERSTNDFLLKEVAGTPLMKITVWAPLGNEITPGTKTREDQQAVKIGSWTVSSVTPMLSVFSDAEWNDPVLSRTSSNRAKSGSRNKPALAAPDTCAALNGREARACIAFRTLDPQTVLNFEVDDKVTVAQALAGEQAIGAARDALVKSATLDAAAPAARAVCSLVTDKAQRLGFNRFDVAAIAWAYASQSNLTVNRDAGKALRDPQNCSVLRLAYDVGLNKGEFAADPATPPG